MQIFSTRPTGVTVLSVPDNAVVVFTNAIGGDTIFRGDTVCRCDERRGHKGVEVPVMSSFIQSLVRLSLEDSRHSIVQTLVISRVVSSSPTSGIVVASCGSMIQSSL